jgi:hypothetical protein
MTQEDYVSEHLRFRGSITADEALREYSIRQLPARIKHLRDRGMPIFTDLRYGLNARGQLVRYAVYRWGQHDESREG